MMRLLRTISTRNEPTQFRTRRNEGPTSGRLLLGGVDTVPGTCLSGAGVPQIKALGIQPLLDDGRLVDLFPDWPDDRLTLYTLYPSRHLPAAKVRALIEFVMAAKSPKAGRPCSVFGQITHSSVRHARAARLCIARAA